jgi:hypothetical protein
VCLLTFVVTVPKLAQVARASGTKVVTTARAYPHSYFNLHLILRRELDRELDCARCGLRTGRSSS